MHKSLYFDYNATTPVDPRVYQAMEPYFQIYFGNPASQLHSKGWEAQSAVDLAREKVAQLIGAQTSEIAFTASATESNNWALKGLVDFFKEEYPGQVPHVLSTQVEHASVREPLLNLRQKGLVEVDFLPVTPEGFVTIEQLEKHRKPHTRILSVIWVQNEVGTIQNMKALAEWAQKYNIILHTDATQAVGKIEVNVTDTPVSLLSFSGHKIYGPKGIGALYIRKRKPKVILRPLLHGGQQESLGRSGTLNVPGIVGLGEACSLAQKEFSENSTRARKQASWFWSELKSQFPALQLNGPSLESRTPYNLNITFPNIQSFELLPLISPLCASGGSACSSGQLQGSSVLQALGAPSQEGSTTLRLSHGRMTTNQEFEKALEILSNALKTLGFLERSRSSQSLTTVLK